MIDHCYLNRISLSDYAYYKTPNLTFDKTTGQGNPFLYCTQGVAFAEISLDRFTGEVKVLRTDILMDLGRMIDRLIDYGQVCGAFIQGLGWVTSEEVFRDKGRLLSRSPTTYKIPNIQDLPRVFNVDFISNDGNSINVRGSKAVGEPPFPLALAVWCAIKNALSYVHSKKIPKLKLPATNEAVILVDVEDLAR